MKRSEGFKLTMFLTLLAIFMAFSSDGFAVELKGNFQQGGMVVGHIDDGKVASEVWLNDKPVKIGADGYFVFGFLRDEAPSAVLKIIYDDGSVAEQILEIAAQTYDIERVDGLPPKTVDIPPEELARRRIERSKVSTARSSNGDQLHWLETFIKPAEGRISGVYGSQRILNGSPRFPHYGLDVAAPIGTAIVAPASGVITLADPDFLLEGGIVIIDHGFSIFSTLFHMNSVAVSLGQQVAQGEVIGTVGQKGRASGPHVDWRINWGKVRLDPQLLLVPAVDDKLEK